MIQSRRGRLSIGLTASRDRDGQALGLAHDSYDLFEVDPFPKELSKQYEELRFAYEWQFIGSGG